MASKLHNDRVLPHISKTESKQRIYRSESGIQDVPLRLINMVLQHSLSGLYELDRFPAIREIGSL